MKMKKVMVVCSLFLLILAVGPASAHSVFMDPVGNLAASEGEALTLNVYAHADAEDAISFFQMGIGFDDGELDFVSYTYNTDMFDLDPGFYPGTYKPGGSNVVGGASLIATMGALGPGMESVPVAAGEDMLLFSIDFTYAMPEYSWTGNDVWIEFDTMDADAVYWDTNFDGDTNIAANGADFAAAPVPVPAAVWLLGSGLVGLVGLRRKTR